MLTLTSPQIELLRVSGSDQGIVEAAKVVHPGIPYPWAEGEAAGIINYMMEHRHGSPFEQTELQFYGEMPIFTLREFERHRIGFAFQDEISLNVESGRYSELTNNFWVPNLDRPIKKGTAFKHSRPVMTADPHLAKFARECLVKAYTVAWEQYELMLAAGVPREVARACLGVGVYSRLYFKCNVRSLLHFLSLRTQDERAKIKSYPQQEIQDVAALIEAEFARSFPLSHAAFNRHGRVGP
jgi:thymidylate synthase (FAD)